VHDITDHSELEVSDGELFLQEKEHGREDKKVPVGEGMGASGQGNNYLFVTLHKALELKSMNGC
jgi:hypothetical protein